MYMRADVVLFVALLQNPLLQCSSQSIFVHWDKATDGFVRPQLNGIDKPANSPFALEPTANRTEENLLASHWHIPSNIIISSVYNGTLNMSDSPVLDGLASKKLKSICAAENISCTSCWNKNHYKSAILQHIHSISIRSLKNFLAVRGLRCHECKTKADLERIAVYGAHLPHRKFVLPAVMIPNFWLFPRGTLKLNILEPQFQFMLRLIEQQGDQRFALLPTKNVGIIARVTKLEYPTDGQVEVQIVGEQRFRAEGSLWTLAGHFAQDVALVNGTLLTDQPVPAAATAELRVADKGARRAFFWLDTDRWAARRAETLLGSPPPESDGPEALSHWLGMALNEPRLQAEMFVSNSTAARLALARAALDYFRAALPGSQAAANWTGTLKPLSLPGPAQDTLPSSTSKKETSAEPVNAATVSQEERAASREEKAAAREAKAAAAAEKEKAAAAQKKVAAPVQKEREKPAAVAQKKTDAAAARAAATEQKEKPKKEKASASASAQKDNENASTVQKDKEKVSAAAAAAEQGEKPTKEKKAAAAQSKREKGATAQKEKERAETAQKVTEKSSSSSSSAAAVAGAAEKGKEKPQKENEKRAQKAMSAASSSAVCAGLRTPPSMTANTRGSAFSACRSARSPR